MKQTKKQKCESSKRYYQHHKEEHAEWSKNYYLEHKDEYKARAQQYYQENKSELKEKHKKYYDLQKAKEYNKKQGALLDIISAVPVIDVMSIKATSISNEHIENIEDLLLQAIEVLSAKTKYRELCDELILKAKTIFEFYRLK